MPFSRILRLQHDKWNNPEDSIGTFIGYLRGGRYRCWEAVGPARLAFSELSPDIKNCLETSSIPPTDTVSWSIYMVGHTEEHAAPKILICSTDLKTRKNIRKLIRDKALLPLGCRVDGTILTDGPEPALGKRIFVVNPQDFSLRPATTGPIILQDGKCYQVPDRK
ncbi:PNG1- with de-N-glycosylation function (N-glycanase) [Fusarium agapanthi]|uniref:PNG1- with de-N-glycosylation function (N-glycanase) n=1 Tax=Fusarium agapanthi TaxID=1803897 RepID=A0A9P5BFC0_9HYPO|nr:PNG1- with de-N-glycosylation function (N-glycanase) [Fusarium agapanthi]